MKTSSRRPSTSKQAGTRSRDRIAPARLDNGLARVGSVPKTRFRGDPSIFGRLVLDHDLHRQLLSAFEEAQGHSTRRRKLFREFIREVKAHAAAEEQALWSTVLRHPEATEFARHAVAEHKELDDRLADLAARDMSTSAWRRRYKEMKEEYLHHIKEEEQEQFVAAQKVLTPADARYMRGVFNRRKKEEKAGVTIEMKIKRKL
jgi:hypothetical protein